MVTVARSDFGIYKPLLSQASSRPEVDLRILASGMHLAPEFGLTIREIEEAGFDKIDRVEMLLSSDTPEGTAKSMGVGILGFAQLFAREKPDWLIVLGDRFEMFAAVAAALPFQIPTAHLHGGELTFGAIDEAMRHCITKMSHLHFASTPEYANRIIQLGEDPWRVSHCGALSLEDVQCSLSFAELEKKFGVNLDPAPLLVTFHPVTLGYEKGLEQQLEMLAALEESALPCVITLPNADAGGRALASGIHDFATRFPDRVRVVENFGREGYFGMLKHASAMIGNSSSGILEAGAFALPVVNIGDRQAGRTRGANVLDVPPERSQILAAIRRAVSPEFRKICEEAVHPYYPPAGKRPSEIILDKVLSTPVDKKLLVKRFYDLNPVNPS